MRQVIFVLLFSAFVIGCAAQQEQEVTDLPITQPDVPVVDQVVSNRTIGVFDEQPAMERETIDDILPFRASRDIQLDRIHIRGSLFSREYIMNRIDVSVSGVPLDRIDELDIMVDYLGIEYTFGYESELRCDNAPALFRTSGVYGHEIVEHHIVVCVPMPRLLQANQDISVAVLFDGVIVAQTSLRLPMSYNKQDYIIYERMLQ